LKAASWITKLITITAPIIIVMIIPIKRQDKTKLAQEIPRQSIFFFFERNRK